MKRRNLYPVLLSLAALPGLALGQDVPQPDTPAGDSELMPESPTENVTDAFDSVDLDGNGILSIEEAQDALPELTIEDANGDGWLNHAEVEQAFPEVQLSGEGGGEYAVVGEADFLEIRQTLRGDERTG